MTPFYEDDLVRIMAGDCREVMAAMGPESIDSIVTDPPYGIGFMGHAWDQPGEHGASSGGHGHRRNISYGAAPHPAIEVGLYDQSPKGRATFQAWCEAWGRECLRVTKPGGWLLSFGSPRSHHRLAVGLEDAGWELTDEIEWLFAQGLPKGRTTLKPAHEPIILARKPAPRVTPLQIDDARIPFSGAGDEDEAKLKNRHADYLSKPRTNNVFGPDARPRGTLGNYDAVGRWPANVVLTDPVLDPGTEGVEQAREQPAGGHFPAARGPSRLFSASRGGVGSMNGQDDLDESRLSTGSYSRYFLVPKASRRERSAGLDHLPERPILWSSGTKSPGTFQSPGTKRAARNHHPTVKPLALMDHLVRLVTPVGGIVLDPFLGSGTTALAAVASGRRCFGIEREESYCDIAVGRLVHLYAQDRRWDEDAPPGPGGEFAEDGLWAVTS